MTDSLNMPNSSEISLTWSQLSETTLFRDTITYDTDARMCSYSPADTDARMCRYSPADTTQLPITPHCIADAAAQSLSQGRNSSKNRLNKPSVMTHYALGTTASLQPNTKTK